MSEETMKNPKASPISSTRQRISIIYRREISNYLNTPIGYVFAIACLFFNFLFFFLGIFDIVPAFFDAKVASVRGYMNLLPVTFILMVPAVSMRIWAEERKSGTIELLSTLPVTDWDLVIGKLFAAWTYVGAIILSAVPLTFGIAVIGDLPLGTTFAQFLGSILMAGAYVAMGMVISALTKEQIVAFIITFFVSLFMFLSNYYIISQHMSPKIANAIGFFSHSYHYTSFARGLIDFGDVVYYLSFISLMVMANVYILRRER